MTAVEFEEWVQWFWSGRDEEGKYNSVNYLKLPLKLRLKIRRIGLSMIGRSMIGRSIIGQSIIADKK